MATVLAVKTFHICDLICKNPKQSRKVKYSVYVILLCRNEGRGQSPHNNFKSKLLTS